jgi:hypothetical protein
MRFLFFLRTPGPPQANERNIGTAIYWFCLHFLQIEKVGNPT